MRRVLVLYVKGVCAERRGNRADARTGWLHTSCTFAGASSASSKRQMSRPLSNKMLRIDSGARTCASGYSLGSRSARLCALMRIGASVVTVVVVVVTVVVVVAGANENWPMVACESRDFGRLGAAWAWVFAAMSGSECVRVQCGGWSAWASPSFVCRQR